MENIENLDINFDESDDEEEIQITSGELVEMVEEMWLNEKFAPEILPHKFEVVDCMLEQLNCMEENLKTLRNSDLQKNLHQMEMDRLRFMITSYLRKRIEKIENYVLAILKQEEDRLKNGIKLYLTENEILYAKNFKESLEQLFENVLKSLPLLPSEDWQNSPNLPNMNSYVFVKSKDEIQGVVINNTNEDDGDLVDFKVGTQIIIPYNTVANLVKDNKVCLI